MNAQNFATAIEKDATVRAQVESTLQAILDRSTTDQAFRFKLLADSRAAIAEFSGMPIESIPEGVLNFAERTNTILLPQYVGSQELTDGDLESVAGGTIDPISLCLIAVIGVEVGVLAGILIYEAGKANPT